MSEAGPTWCIGIDPGVSTGLAIWCSQTRALIRVETVRIHEALSIVSGAKQKGMVKRVRVEDASQRKWFGDADSRQKRSGAGIREGVGSVKRDCTIWRDFLAANGIPYDMVKPAAGTTKWDAKTFTKLTKWKGRTSKHARDAALLVFGL